MQDFLSVRRKIAPSQHFHAGSMGAIEVIDGHHSYNFRIYLLENISDLAI